jgi:hypothetical protein
VFEYFPDASGFAQTPMMEGLAFGHDARRLRLNLD